MYTRYRYHIVVNLLLFKDLLISMPNILSKDIITGWLKVGKFEFQIM